MQGSITRLLRAATDLILPRSCVHCGHSCNHQDYEFLCKKCASEIFIARNPCCTTYGYPYLGAFVDPKLCPHYAELDPLFDQGRTLFLAQGSGRNLLHELKYRRGFNQSQKLATILAKTCQAEVLNLLRRTQFTQPKLN